MSIELKVRTTPVHSTPNESDRMNNDSQVHSNLVLRPEGAETKATDSKPYAASVTAHVLGINDKKLAAQLSLVPNTASMVALSAGTGKPDEVAKALKAALLSPTLKVLQKATRTLQVAEAYQRKASMDASNYKNPSGNPLKGFVPVKWPGLKVTLSEAETQQLKKMLADGSAQEIGVLLMSAKAGLIQTTPPNALQLAIEAKTIAQPNQSSYQLPASQGVESPRDAAGFPQEFSEHVKPAADNINLAQELTAERNSKITGVKCPYAQGNHAKGVAFGDVKMNVDKDAPEWAKDLFGKQLDGGMLRVSGSMTDPLQPDSEPHQPGLRLVLPLKNSNGTTQLIDLTANGGDTTHAQTADRHTAFTNNTSLPQKDALDLTPLRAIKHLVKEGDVVKGVKELYTALTDSKKLNGERFDEHQFYGRHTYFVGGRYVQIRIEVKEPKPFPDASKSSAPNAQIDAVSKTVAKEGMKLAMYITELPPGADPGLIEKEYGEDGGWQGLPEYKLATIDVPVQTTQGGSDSSKFFASVPHVPGGPDKVFTGAGGIGRERVLPYFASGLKRNDKLDKSFPFDWATRYLPGAR